MPQGVDWGSIANYGGLGLVCLWFMLRMEPRLKAVEAACDRFSRSMLIAAARNDADGLHEAAKSLVDEINSAERERLK